MRRTAAAVLLVLGLAPRAFASLGTVGPTDPVNGFPVWYTDGTGRKLDLCLDPAFCFFDPPIAGNPFSQLIGFGAEAFWWNADAALDIPGSGQGSLVTGLEAAFLNTDPVDGEQVVFARIRIRADLPVAGTYTVTHPFGVDVFNVTEPGQDAIKFTEDVGGVVAGDFTTALGTRIGPFLVAVNPPPPPGFVGNFNVLQTVTGSPFGTNVFRIDGPPGSNLDGNGNSFVTTSLFNLQGRVHPCPPIDVSPVSLPGGVRGDPYAAALSASGGTGPYTFAVTSGALPPGLSLAANGALSGTPSASGSYNFTVTATDQNLCGGSRSYTINIACGVVVVLPPTLPDASQGLPYSQQLTAPGSAPWTFTVTAGALPPGLTLSAAGLLAGTPTTFGDSSFTVMATDPNSCSGSRAYAFHVGCGNVVVSPPSLPSGVQGTPYGQTLTASGGTAPYGFAVTAGALPPGLTLASNGALSGTPTLPGNFNFTVTSTDVNACAGSRAYSVTIACPTIAVLPATLPSGQQSAPYSQTLSANGGTAPHAFAVSAGALPPGLTLTPAGQLSGTPTLPGSFNFSVTTTDANGCTGSRAYTLVVSCATITVSPASLPDGVRWDPYAATLSASGGTGPHTFTVTSGALPPGLTLASNGNLTGTPTATGSYTFTVTATDQNLCIGSRSYTIDIACGVVNVLPPTLPDASQGLPYSQQLSSSQPGTWSFTVTGGTLPPGITLSTAGLLSGTPTTFGDSSFTVTATDPSSCSGSRLYAFHVGCGNVAVAPSSLPSGVQGTPYGQTLTASGGTAPYGFAVTAGALPPGLTLASNGALSGTPTLPGSYNFTATATDVNACAGSRAYSVTIACPTIAVLPATLPSGQQSAPYTQTLTASGGTGPYAFTLGSGTLPPGLTLTPAGQLSGTPTLPGSFNFSVTATDANGCTGLRAYTLVVACATIDVSPASLPDGVRGDPYAATLSASGGTGPYTFSVTSGTLPPGLGLAADGSLTGTPTAAGSYTFTVTATDQNLCTGSRSYTVDIACGVVDVLPPTLPDASQGLPYSQQLSSSQPGTWSFAVTAGTLPPGLTLSTTGLLSGAPTTFGDSSFTVAATDPASCSGSRAYALHVGCGNVTVAPPSLPSGVQGTAYSQALTASGGTAPYGFAVTAGALPPGLTLAADGTLSGTPTLPGSFNFTATATDPNGCAGSRAYTLVIDCPTVTVLPATLPAGQQNAPYAQTLTASGGTGPYAFALSAGVLPPGLTLTPAGQLSGTPTLPGSFNFSVTATDANGCTGSRAYSMVVDCEAIDVLPASLPDGVRGDPYAATLSASGGTGPHTFAVTSGSLPPGLTLAPDGSLTGTPSATGSYTFTVTATDQNLCSGSRSYTIDIACGAVDVLPPTLPDASQGLPYSQQLVSSEPGTWSFTVTAGTLPPGVTLSTAGLLSGTPTDFGDSSFTVTATDAASCSGSRDYALHVGCGTVAVAPPTLPPATRGVPYSQALTATGGTAPYGFAVTLGALPPGLALAADGTLSGTPTLPGSFDFTVTASDPNGCQGALDYSLLVRDPLLSVGDATLVEADAGTTDLSFTVSLSEAIGEPVTVDYATAGVTATSGIDFLPASGTLTFLPPGTMTQTILVAVVGDSASEPDETFSVTLSTPTGATIDDGEGQGAIVNDDPLVAVETTRELQHGSALWRSLGTLAGGVPRDDWFRVAQRAHASYEVLVDGTTGDIGDGGPLLERVASDGFTTLQGSAPAGAGGSRSLRWENASGADVDDQYVRLRSAGCTSDCNAEDGCRIRALVTTAGAARFNNSASQSTVLVLQNTGDDTVTGHAWFWGGAGTLLGEQAFTLAPRATLVLPTAGVPGVGGASGSITVSHDGGFGQINGKAVAVEPATGFTFDTPLLSRPR